MPNISNLVKSIQDIMRKDAGTYGDAQRIEQMAWLFFLKIFDDRETQLELFDDDYKSPLKAHLRWRSWAADEEGMTGEALLDFINLTLLPALKNMTAGQDHTAGLIRMTFEDANNYMKNGTLMRQVVNKINAIDFNASDDRHLFGDIYEKILKDLQSAGNAGEFYTPRAVTQFIVEQVNPRLGETVFDPACGTGGFLTCAIDHLRDQAKTDKDMATSREMNKRLGRSGSLLQDDYWDRLIRNDRHFFEAAEYIRGNPAKAKLREGEFVFWEWGG